VIRQRADGIYYRACLKCARELDLAQGEWVPDFPDRKIHGYRVSQLFSSTVDPGEILQDYRTTHTRTASTTSRSGSRGRTWNGESMCRRSSASAAPKLHPRGSTSWG
jgi:hypothetical protein